MIKILAEFKIKEAKKTEFTKLLEELVIAARKEDGCLAYDVFENNNDPNQMTLIEEWKDKKALEEHNNTEHFTRIVPKLAELCAEEIKINTYKKII